MPRQIETEAVIETPQQPSWKVVELSLVVNNKGRIQTFTRGKGFSEEKTKQVLVEIFGETKAEFAITKLMNAELPKVESKEKAEKRAAIAKEFTPAQIAEFKKLGILK